MGGPVSSERGDGSRTTTTDENGSAKETRTESDVIVGSMPGSEAISSPGAQAVIWHMPDPGPVLGSAGAL